MMTRPSMFALAAVLSLTACGARPDELHLPAADEPPAPAETVALPAVRVNKAPS